VTDPFGTVPTPISPLPVPAGEEGATGPILRRTVPATVLTVLGAENGVVQHRVELLGATGLLEALTEIAPGTVLEVIARRDGALWRAILPGAPRSPAAGNSTSSAIAKPSRGASLHPSNSPGSPAEAGGRATEEASQRLLERGIEPTGPLLRGGARVLSTRSDPTEASVGTRSALDGAIARLLGPLEESLPPLAEGIRALSQLRVRLGVLPGAAAGNPLELVQVPEQIVVEIARAVEQLVASDPRIAALRQAIAALLGDGAVGDLPASVRGLLAGGGEPLDWPEGLTATARMRGLEMLRAQEIRAIEEHPALQALQPLLREVVERAETLAYRWAIEIADRHPERGDPLSREWVVTTSEQNVVRVRFRKRQSDSSSPDDETPFHIETDWPDLGSVVVDGSVSGSRSGGGAMKTQITLSAERLATRVGLLEDLDALEESFTGTGIEAEARVVPWRRVRRRTSAPSSTPPSAASRLDRKA
jgi:hypothetical protein